MRRSRIADAILVAIALALLVAVAALRAMRPQPEFSVPSTYDTGGNGYAALYDLLARERVPVRRLEQPFGDFHARRGALVLAGDGAISAAVPGRNIAALDAWVRSGGTLFVFGDTSIAERRALGLPPPAGMKKAWIATAACGLARPLHGLRAGGEFAAGYARTCAANRATLLEASGRAIVVAYRRGSGTIVVSSTPSVFGNRELASHDNAALAYAFFGGMPVVWFDERIYGHAIGRSFWEVLPWPMHAAIVLACILLALAIIGANLPSAPPAALEAPAERDTGAYIASLARMLQRGGAGREMIARMHQHVRRVLLQRSVADDEARALLDRFDALAVLTRPTPRDVLAAGRLFARARKEYEW